jgi:hypothetical protein
MNKKFVYQVGDNKKVILSASNTLQDSCFNAPTFAFIYGVQILAALLPGRLNYVRFILIYFT